MIGWNASTGTGFMCSTIALRRGTPALPRGTRRGVPVRPARRMRRETPASPHAKNIEFVAIGIAKISGIESAATIADRAFVLCAE